MPSCYDCLFCGVCSDAGDAGFSCLKEDVSKCKNFKNKSEYTVVKTADLEMLKGFIKGEWVDTEPLCRVLDIDFSRSAGLFDFSRAAKWDGPSLNGQKITTKFRLINGKLEGGERLD